MTGAFRKIGIFPKLTSIGWKCALGVSEEVNPV